jgi:hypothetical protein
MPEALTQDWVSRGFHAMPDAPIRDPGVYDAFIIDTPYFEVGHVFLGC